MKFHGGALSLLLLASVVLCDDDSQRFFTATQSSLFAGVPTLCMEQDSAINPLNAYFRNPMFTMIPSNSTKYVVTQPQSGGNNLRILSPSGATSTASANIFSLNGASGESFVGGAVEPLTQSLYVSSSFRLVKLMSGSAPSSSALATTTVCGMTSSANGNDGSCSTATFSGPIHLATMSYNDTIASGTSSRVLFAGDGSTVRLINLDDNTISTVCGIWNSANTIDGACSGVGLLRAVGAIAVGLNQAQIIVYVLQTGDAYLRKLVATVTTDGANAIPTSRLAWTLSTIGPSRIGDNGAAKMSITTLGGPLSVFYSSGEGTAFTWSQSVGTQQIASNVDGYECNLGAVSTTSFRVPYSVVQSLPMEGSNPRQSVILSDFACCTLTNISGTWQAATSLLRIKTAAPFPPSSAALGAFGSYSAITGMCSDGGDDGVNWVFITDSSNVVISTSASTFSVISTAYTDILNCVVIRNATSTIAYLIHTSSYMITYVDVMARAFLGVFCGTQLYGVTNGACSNVATFTQMSSAYFDKASLEAGISPSNPLGFWVGDTSKLRYVMVSLGPSSNAAANVTTVGTTVSGDSILGIAMSPTYIYVATTGTTWCSCILRSAAFSVFRGASAGVLTQTSGVFTNYFGPSTSTVGFAYFQGVLLLTTNAYSSNPGVMLSFPVNGTVVNMGSMRVVAGAAADTIVYAAKNKTAGISPTLMKLSSATQIVLTYSTNVSDGESSNASSVVNGIAVPDSARAIVWRFSYVDLPIAAPGICSISSNCSNNAVNATLLSDTFCNCTCASRWTGQDCSFCPPQYNNASASPAPSCGSCASGFSDFPACYSKCTTGGNCSDHATSVEGNTHTGCNCTCRNMWSGPLCNICTYPLDSLADCLECVRGYTGYPNCTRSSWTQQHNGTSSLSTTVASASAAATMSMSATVSVTSTASVRSLSATASGLPSRSAPKSHTTSITPSPSNPTHTCSKVVTTTPSLSLSLTPSHTHRNATASATATFSATPSHIRTPSRPKSLTPTKSQNHSSHTLEGSHSASGYTTNLTGSPTTTASDSITRSLTIRTSNHRFTLTKSTSLSESDTTSESRTLNASTTVPKLSPTRTNSVQATNSTELMLTPSLLLSGSHTRTHTYVPPPPPTVAPKILECTGRATVLLSYNTSTALVLPLTTALTAAYVLTLQITSCHTFGLPLSIDAVRSDGTRPDAGSITQQSTSLKGKKLTLIVGPLSPYVQDASEDVVVTILPPKVNAAALFSPNATDGVQYAVSSGATTSSNATVSFTNVTQLPNATMRFTASATSLSASTVAAMQAGVTSVSVVTVVVSSPALAGSAQRQALLTNVAECPNPLDASENTLSFMTHPLQFPIGDSIVRFYAGAMVGDLVVMIAILVLVALVTLALGAHHREPFWIAAWRTRFPTVTMPIINIMSQSAMNGALVSLLYGDEVGTTLGSVIVFLIVLIGIVWVVHRTIQSVRSESRFADKPTVHRLERAALHEVQERKELERRVAFAVGKGPTAAMRLQRANVQTVSEASVAKARRRRTYSTVERMGTWKHSFKIFAQDVTRARGFWTPVTHPEYLHTYGAVYEELEPEGIYFLWVEVIQNVVSVFIMSYVPTTAGGCRNQFISVLIVLTLYAVLCCIIRPYLSRIATLIACTIAVLQAAAAWTLFIAFQLDSGGWMTAYAVINFGTLGVQALAGLHGIAKALWEIRTGRDPLSRGLSLWTAVDKRGLAFLVKLDGDKALANWPKLDPVIAFRLAGHVEATPSPDDESEAVKLSMLPRNTLSERVAPYSKFTKEEADDLLLADALRLSGDFSTTNSGSDFDEEMDDMRVQGRGFQGPPPLLQHEDAADDVAAPLEVPDATDALLEFLDATHKNRLERANLL